MTIFFQTAIEPVWDVWEVEQLAAGSVPQVTHSRGQNVSVIAELLSVNTIQVIVLSSSNVTL